MNPPRRLLLCFSVISLSVISAIFMSLEYKETQKTGFLRINPGESQLIIKENNLIINGYDDYGITYFFIPSYARISSLSYEMSNLKMYTPDGDVLEHPHFNTIQDVLVDTEEGKKSEYKVAFCQSENLDSLYIDTKGVGIENISREEYAPISLMLITPKGLNIYTNDNVFLKGRGNHTFTNAVQKSYQLLLPDDLSISGMTKSNQWALLPSTNDKSRICNKLAMDTSAALGMEYAIESDWIDVFVDGLYWGNYLICHEPHIGKDDLNIYNLEKQNKTIDIYPERIDNGLIKAFGYSENPDNITGGYLFSLDQYPDKRSCGFFFDDNFIHIKSPDNASVEEGEYISSFFGSIDHELHNGFFDNIDFYSFARRYIVEEILMNWDYSRASYYYYKKSNNDTIYAGPCWDYDGVSIQSKGCNTTISILDSNFGYGYEGALDWDRKLMENEAYRNYVIQTFNQYSWLWNQLISRQLDSYYERVGESLNMSYLRWIKIEEESDIGYYIPPSDAFQILKSNLSDRLLYLSERWEID